MRTTAVTPAVISAEHAVLVEQAVPLIVTVVVMFAVVRVDAALLMAVVVVV